MTQLSEHAQNLDLWMTMSKFKVKIAEGNLLQADLDSLVSNARGFGIKWPHGVISALAELGFTGSRNAEETSLKSITPIPQSTASRQHGSRPRLGGNTDQDTDGGFGSRKK